MKNALLSCFLLISMFPAILFGQVIFTSDFSDAGQWEVTGTSNWQIGTNPTILDFGSFPTDANGFAYVFGAPNETQESILSPLMAWSGHGQYVALDFRQVYVRQLLFNARIEFVNAQDMTVVDVVHLDQYIPEFTAGSDRMRVVFNTQNLPLYTFRFVWENDPDLPGLFWAMDDLVFEVAQPEDIRIETPQFGQFEVLNNSSVQGGPYKHFLSYSKVPQTVLDNYYFQTRLYNAGSELQNVAALFEISNGATTIFSEITNHGDLAPGAFSIALSNGYSSTLPIGSYTASIDVTSLNTPINSASGLDAVSWDFEVDQYILAKDRGMTDAIPLDYASSSDYYVETDFYVDNAYQVYAVQVGIHESSNQQGSLVIEIFDESQTSIHLETVLVETSDFGTIKNVPLSESTAFVGGQWYTVRIRNGQNSTAFSPGLKFAASGDLDLRFTRFLTDTGMPYIFPQMPIIRLSGNPCDGPVDLTTSLSITNSVCPGNCQGAAQIVEFNPIFTYSWFDNQDEMVGSGPEIVDLCEGTGYYLQVEGCEDSYQAEFDIIANQQFNFVDIMTTDASYCSAEDGVITLFLETTNDYSFDELIVQYSGPSSGATSIFTETGGHQISGLLPGEYTLTITDSDNDCNSLEYTVTIDYLPIDVPICVVTVDSLTSDFNVVVWEKPADLSAIDSFYVYREVTTNNYDKKGAVHRDSLSEFYDYTANPNVTGYRYKLSVLDVCGNETDLSEYHNTIHLQYQGNGNFNWNHYLIENQSAVVSSYRFYRDNEDDGTWSVIGSTSGTQNTYTVSDYLAYPNAVYRVEVDWVDGTVCSSSRAQDYNSSRSNKRGGVVGDPVGLNENTLTSIQIFPNPATEELNIISSEELLNVKVINTLGAEVLQLTEPATNKLNISTLSRGVYFVQVKTPSGITTTRLIKK